MAMRHLGFLVLFLVLIGFSRAALQDGANQITGAVSDDLCETIFGIPCTLPNITVNNSSDCICVPHYQCTKKGGSIITDGKGIGLINRRIKVCDDDTQYCCYSQHVDNTINEETTSSQISVREGCGYRNPQGIKLRLTAAGDKTQFAEFPWMVAVMQDSSNGTNKSFEGGGSLIHPQVVLTSAHNVENYVNTSSQLIVRAGERETAPTTELLPYQERRVERLILHEKYDTGNLHNDFAILILETAFDIAPNVNTICLPPKEELFDGANCIVTGWGKDKFDRDGQFQSILKKIELPVVPHSTCQTSLRSTRLGLFYILDQSFICAGGKPNQDSCTGDGGGPLVCPLKNAQDRYVQAGIVSWGIGCGDNGIPGVYANVPLARRWIDRNMALYNLETKSYVA